MVNLAFSVCLDVKISAITETKMASFDLKLSSNHNYGYFLHFFRWQRVLEFGSPHTMHMPAYGPVYKKYSSYSLTQYFVWLDCRILQVMWWFVIMKRTLSRFYQKSFLHLFPTTRTNVAELFTLVFIQYSNCFFCEFDM